MNVLTIIDNYDSFTYNLVQELGRLGGEMRVWRNDEKSVEEILAEEPEGIIISPGPCTPNEAGISIDLLRAVVKKAEAGKVIPLLGVCLGHQALAAAFGGIVRRAPEIVHGKQSPVFHSGEGLLKELEQGFTAGRYHSLIVEEDSLGEQWQVTARTAEGLVMGIQHNCHPFFGLQFHPESILTPKGEKILQAFLDITRKAEKSQEPEFVPQYI
jgi:anthranilate synthase component 2